MRIYDIIAKKRDGMELSREELEFFVNGSLGDIPDYQLSALLMAICIRGMSEREISDLTLLMAKSGDMMDLSRIEGVTVDKHSTGGVGDKTTLIAGPIAAACGVKVAKMSGRGLGYTGGTIDKLESIPGFRTSLTNIEFFDIVNCVGICVVGQTANLAPADKKLYALRDVTATVESIPLIASSVMSKKLAAGSDCILLDVKAGRGAFMKTQESALELARLMVAIGKRAGRRTSALITDMEMPLGRAIGNSLEVIEAVETLSGKGPEDITSLCLELAANMLLLASKNGGITLTECRRRAEEALRSGAALKKFEDMVRAQGGDVAYLRDTELFASAAASGEYTAGSDGYIRSIDAEGCGITASMLGAGRDRAGDPVDPAAGILLLRKPGDYVRRGEPLAILYGSNEMRLVQGLAKIGRCFEISPVKPAPRKIILASV